MPNSTPHRPPRITRFALGMPWRGALLQIGAWVSVAVTALAQDAAPPGGAGQTQVIHPGPNLYGQGILVVVLCGLALFAVCRSSRRN